MTTPEERAQWARHAEAWRHAKPFADRILALCKDVDDLTAKAAREEAVKAVFANGVDDGLEQAQGLVMAAEARAKKAEQERAQWKRRAESAEKIADDDSGWLDPIEAEDVRDEVRAAEARVAELEQERDDLTAKVEEDRRKGGYGNLRADLLAANYRADKADAEVQRLRDGITALADSVCGDGGGWDAEWHLRTCGGDPTCLICIWLNLTRLLAPQVQDKPKAAKVGSCCFDARRTRPCAHEPAIAEQIARDHATKEKD